MCVPNIFHDYATSELSQDAWLAYVLAWADPKYEKWPALHKLGQDLLLALLRKAGRRIGKIKTVIVKTQDHKVDISVDINGKFFMIIEDKIKAGPHGNQIERYKRMAAVRFKEKEKNHDIVAIYLKTGNESKVCHPEPKVASCFFRKDLLDVLNRNPNTGNDIVEEFRTHLQHWEDDTQSFRKTKPSEWSWSAVEGFFMALEKRLDEEGPDEKDKGWHYVHKGDFLGFWWKPDPNGEHEYETYLQIAHAKLALKKLALNEHAKRALKLYVRVSSNEITQELHNALWEKIESVVAKWPDITVKRCGHTGKNGKKSAKVAQICFEKTDCGFPAKKADGTLDFDETMRRIRRAIELLNNIPPQSNGIPA